ncbi:MAG TPA: RES family NAD+ phosphorylase [Parafilimonas sp.]|nr:RES family NAD+ phosphorylase [Parafilimonas sp.]
MKVYRIAKKKHRVNDLSGTGAYNEGGRWNSPGTYALYTSEHRSLAALEVLVHVDETELPPNLFIMTIDISEQSPVYEMPDDQLPADWRIPGNLALQIIGDQIFRENNYLAIKARSAVLPQEYNYILNPLFPGFYELVKITEVFDYEIDKRLL